MAASDGMLCSSCVIIADDTEPPPFPPAICMEVIVASAELATATVLPPLAPTVQEEDPEETVPPLEPLTPAGFEECDCGADDAEPVAAGPPTATLPLAAEAAP